MTEKNESDVDATSMHWPDLLAFLGTLLFGVWAVQVAHLGPTEMAAIAGTLISLLVAWHSYSQR